MDVRSTLSRNGFRTLALAGAVAATCLGAFAIVREHTLAPVRASAAWRERPLSCTMPSPDGRFALRIHSDDAEAPPEYAVIDTGTGAVRVLATGNVALDTKGVEKGDRKPGEHDRAVDTTADGSVAGSLAFAAYGWTSDSLIVASRLPTADARELEYLWIDPATLRVAKSGSKEDSLSDMRTAASLDGWSTHTSDGSGHLVFTWHAHGSANAATTHDLGRPNSRSYVLTSRGPGIVLVCDADANGTTSYMRRELEHDTSTTLCTVERARAALLSDDGERLAVTTLDGDVVIHDAHTGARITTLRAAGVVSFVDRDHDRLVESRGTGWFVRDARDGSEFDLGAVLGTDRVLSGVPHVTSCADGHWLVVAGGDGAFLVDPRAHTLVRRL